MPSKSSLRDKLDEDQLDLSLMQLTEVPVEEMVTKFWALFLLMHRQIIFCTSWRPKTGWKRRGRGTSRVTLWYWFFFSEKPSEGDHRRSVKQFFDLLAGLCLLVFRFVWTVTSLCSSVFTLKDTFPSLTHIVKLDLSKNSLEQLPEYFGNLRNLKRLDLYSNKIERLPVRSV